MPEPPDQEPRRNDLDQNYRGQQRVMLGDHLSNSGAGEHQGDVQDAEDHDSDQQSPRATKVFPAQNAERELDDEVGD